MEEFELWEKSRNGTFKYNYYYMVTKCTRGDIMHWE